MEKIIELKAKMILLGCSESSPGFTTVHWAQHELGYSIQSFYKNRYGAMYYNQGKRELYIKTDFGGCSNGFGKFYIEYLNKKIMRTGFVGDAFCITARADQTFSIEMEILQNEPTFCFCTSSICSDCRLSWTFNKRDIVKYFGAVIAKTCVEFVRREK
jgi:aminoglycoside 3-N-acetyltransferase